MSTYGLGGGLTPSISRSNQREDVLHAALGKVAEGGNQSEAAHQRIVAQKEPRRGEDSPGLHGIVACRRVARRGALVRCGGVGPLAAQQLATAPAQGHAKRGREGLRKEEEVPA